MGQTGNSNPFRSGARYSSQKDYFRNRFGTDVRKIVVNAGLTCPNRDGSLGTGGCLYCNSKGSGSGSLLSIPDQISTQITKYQQKSVKKFFVYFQSFSNTYGSPDDLKKIYDSCIGIPGVVGMTIGTRPDCIDEAKIGLIKSYSAPPSSLEVWIEYGLQSIHSRTLEYLNRRHDAESFKSAVLLTAGNGIKTCCHVILGLPDETRRDMLETAEFAGRLPVDGIKIHSLYVEKGTVLESRLNAGEFKLLSQREYVETVCDLLEILPAGMVVQRLTGDPDPGRLAGPDWASRKDEVLRQVRLELENRDSWQGKHRAPAGGV